MSIADFPELLARIAERERADPEAYPAETLRELFAAGLIGAPLPRELGGLGWDLAQAVDLVEALARSSGSAALIAAMPIGLAGLFAFPVELAPAEHRDAWAAQREWAAADYRAGVLFAACNSEKGAGGSLAATTTVARRDTAGTFRLTGEKILATGGRFAGKFFSTGKVDPAELPGGGAVEYFLVDTRAPGVEILTDWDGFGMRSTESQTVRYQDTPALALLGFPNFLALAQPIYYFHCLFAAIPLGCARALLDAMARPAPTSPALRLRLSEALMRYESLRAYLRETARAFHPASPPAYRARVLRTKTYVAQEATKLAAELFALGGGRNYRRGATTARALADAFAGTALRPPLALGLETLVAEFDLGES